MTTAAKIVKELKSLGSEATKKVLIKHGAREPFFGVKVEHLKKIQKRIKKDYQLALDLFDTGNSDAMYLAALIADDARMTKKDLQRWADGAYWYYLSEHAVPWVAAGSPHGREMALKWIESPNENIASTGWATFSSLVGITDDSKLDRAELKKLLKRVEKTIHSQANWVRRAMNGFVICVGCYVSPLTDLAVETGKKIGPVSVDMGGTACKVPFVPEYVERVRKRGSLGKKRKSAKC